MSSGAFRAAAFLASFALSTFIVTAGLRWSLDRASVPYARVNLDQARDLDAAVRRAAMAPPSTYNVILFTDSLSMGPAGVSGPVSVVHGQLRALLANHVLTRKKVTISPLIGSGTTVYSHYFMADRVIEMRPDLVLLEFNLFWLSPSWHAQLDRTVLATWLPASWWPEALTLPLYRTRLTLDRLLLYRAMAAFGLLEPWYALQREQARMTKAYWQLATALQEWAAQPQGLRIRTDRAARRLNLSRDRNQRATPATAERLFGAAMGAVGERHFALVMLDALLTRFRAADIDVVVYVPPHNIDHLAELDMLDRGGLNATLATIDRVVQRRGARLVDLHHALPNAGFRDYIDHFAETPESPGAQLIARRLLPAILQGFAAPRVGAP